MEGNVKTERKEIQKMQKRSNIRGKYIYHLDKPIVRIEELKERKRQKEKKYRKGVTKKEGKKCFLYD